MSQSQTWWRLLVLSTIVLCIVFAANASGQNSKSSNTAFATVDFQKIVNDFKAKAKIESDFQAMKAKFDARLQRRDSMPFLTEEDHKQLDLLTEKDPASRSQAENAKIEELTKKGLQLANEYQALRQKPDKELSDADKQQIKDSEAALIRAQQNYNALKDQLTSELRAFSANGTELLMSQIREAVKKVAEKNNVAVVFNNEFVLYAGTDLTAPVLAELNKQK